MSSTATIKTIVGREVIDSRGNPTVEAEVTLATGEKGIASVPSGASTGSREAIELRDGDKKRFGGKGVLTAVNHVNATIAKSLSNTEIESQSALDNKLIQLDGTQNKEKLGANAILAVSMAYAKARSAQLKMPLYAYLGECLGNTHFSFPVPMMNILNGGAHADNNVDIQEFMILPVGAPNIREAIRTGAEVFHALKAELKKQGLTTSCGDEGGFAPNLSSNQAALDLIMSSIEKAGFKAGKDIYLGLDCASSEFYKEGKYVLASENKSLSSEQLVQLYKQWVDAYPILSIEDGMDESDWAGWGMLTEHLGNRIQCVGDDLFVTNKSILQKGISQKIANSILIKLNQIGTITETIETIRLAKQNDYTTIISHRSGETEDTTIADLSVGCNAGQIKTGAPSRTDRVAKYNQLMRISDTLQAEYSGKNVFKRWIKD